MSTKTLKFTKMHGLGNDFVIIDSLSQVVPLDSLPISHLANRHTGIGFDQLLVLLPSSSADFACRIFNADGTEAEQCGNGMRCLARFISEEKLSTHKMFSIELKTSQVNIQTSQFDAIKIDMGIPQFEPDFNLTLNHTLYQLSILSLGNPHAIIQVSSLDPACVTEWGLFISTHPHFPNGANVGFMQILSPEHILLRTYERGAGETLACGSNACAAAIAGIHKGLLQSPVKVELPLGRLTIEWNGGKTAVSMTGPAQKVFDGVFSL